ncbi:MAG TPA: zinc ribbon domain-containing protein [Vicinamibacterales bacterium]|nr:zinc ribbon domain-containing protein [Vicinamibacterales bacterium]
MPIYEFECRTCERRFETLVRQAETPACPSCGGRDLERALSTFAVGSAAPGPVPVGACGRCGDPRGPGACALD